MQMRDREMFVCLLICVKLSHVSWQFASLFWFWACLENAWVICSECLSTKTHCKHWLGEGKKEVEVRLREDMIKRINSKGSQVRRLKDEVDYIPTIQMSYIVNTNNFPRTTSKSIILRKHKSTLTLKLSWKTATPSALGPNKWTEWNIRNSISIFGV